MDLIRELWKHIRDLCVPCQLSFINQHPYKSCSHRFRAGADMNLIVDSERFLVSLFSNTRSDLERHFSVFNDRCSTAGHGITPYDIVNSGLNRLWRFFSDSNIRKQS